MAPTHNASARASRELKKQGWSDKGRGLKEGDEAARGRRGTARARFSRGVFVLEKQTALTALLPMALAALLLLRSHHNSASLCDGTAAQSRLFLRRQCGT